GCEAAPKSAIGIFQAELILPICDCFAAQRGQAPSPQLPALRIAHGNLVIQRPEVISPSCPSSIDFPQTAHPHQEHFYKRWRIKLSNEQKFLASHHLRERNFATYRNSLQSY
ncbi:hypothetical protein, partial [Pseudomonas jessenii]|uniref:hypothetical protein n=1 Tax=Pseudomonas jessenii TaxID=77298 RepID=UPI0019D43A7A